MTLQVDLRSLFGRMNSTSSRALNTAVGVCTARGHYELTPLHLLSALLDESTSDVPRILSHFAVDEPRVRKTVTSHLERMEHGNPGKPTFADNLLTWLESGWLHSSVDLGQNELRTGGLLLAVVAGAKSVLPQDYLDLLEPIDAKDLRREFDAIVEGSSEQSHARAAKAAGADLAKPGTTTRPPDSALGRFTIDLTAQARAGQIDPIFGRNREIRQMVDILGRRRKNNPIVVGDAGVGKTALVEGLALRVVEGDVPATLANVDILCLDLGLLQAGAGMKGEFENRVKSVIDEVKAAEVPTILFIDEAHMLTGKEGSGGGEAANLLKPALARGELRTIAATTWAEYKKYFEKDSALSRRFQPVRLEEPSEEDTVVILRGLKASYERSHAVTIRDDAVQATVKLSSRYLTGRQLPDKAVDLLDTCAARVKVAQASRPPELEDLRKRVEIFERERVAIQRDGVTTGLDKSAQLDQLAVQITQLGEEASRLEEAWKREREAVMSVLELHQGLQQGTASDQVKAELADRTKALEQIRGGRTLVPVDVDPDIVARTVSDWTGIPLGNMVRDQARSILEIEQRLRERIKGQDHALEAVGRALRAAKAGIGNPNAPMGVFLFVGPSGVGKTETALGIADLLFGGERFLTSVNMSEYQEKHTVSLLKGAPPGYVGYGDPGALSEPVRQRPYSVVLLDEVEKAHPDVLDLFYQVFDKGTMMDGTGRAIDFKNTIIILTSNLGTDIITEMCAGPVPPDAAELAAAVKPAILKHFKPALNARWTAVPFLTIGPAVMREIVELKLGRLAKQLRQNQNVMFKYSQPLVGAIADRCTEVDTGARNIDHVLQAHLLPKIASGVLEQMAGAEAHKTLNVDVDGAGSFQISWSD